MEIGADMIEQFRRVRSEYLTAKGMFDSILKQFSIPAVDDIGNMETNFTQVVSIEFLCEVAMDHDVYYQCGGYYNYFLVVTDAESFFIVEGLAYDRKGGGDGLRFEPQMSTTSRRAYLQYFVDHFEENVQFAEIYDDPQFYLDQLLEEEEFELLRKQIDELFQRIAPHYDSISQHVINNWSAKDYQPIAVNDMKAKEAIKNTDVSGFISNWDQISAVISQDKDVNTSVVKKIDDLAIKLKEFV
jgi:hypothetical protein